MKLTDISETAKQLSIPILFSQGINVDVFYLDFLDFDILKTYSRGKFKLIFRLFYGSLLLQRRDIHKYHSWWSECKFASY